MKQILTAKSLIFLVSIVLLSAHVHAQAPVWQPSPGHTQIPLWPGKVPSARPYTGPEDVKTTCKESLVADKPWSYINNASHLLLQNEDDHVDRVEDSLSYYVALKKAGVPVEMHLYAEGGHAFGLRRTRFPATAWPQLVETWLTTLGMVPQ